MVLLSTLFKSMKSPFVSRQNQRICGRLLHPNPPTTISYNVRIFSTKHVHHTRLSELWKPFIHTATFFGAAVVGSSILEYERWKAEMQKFRNKLSFGSAWQKSVQSQDGIVGILQNWWAQQRQHDKIFYCILGTNIMVFLLTKAPIFMRSLYPYFIIFPPSTGRYRAISMVMSAFCHLSPWHLAFNMYALKTFMGIAVNDMGREQFLGAYFSGAVISSLGSIAFRVFTREGRGACGASGALFAIVTSVVYTHPEINLNIIFLPMFDIPGQKALEGLVLFDLLGLLFFWRKSIIDHAGHLAGVLTGLSWVHFWPSEKKFIQSTWKKITEEL